MAVPANTTNTDEDPASASSMVRQYLMSRGLDPNNAANVRDALNANARFSDQAGADPIAGLRNYGATPDVARGPAAPRYNTGPANLGNVAPAVESGPDPTASPATPAVDSSWLIPAISRAILGVGGPTVPNVPTISLNPQAGSPQLAGPPATPQLAGPEAVPQLSSPPARPQVSGPNVTQQIEGPPKQPALADQRDPMTRSLDKATQTGESPVGGANRGAPAAKPPVVELPGDNTRAQPAPPVEPTNPRFGGRLGGIGMNIMRNAKGGLPGLAIALGMSLPELIQMIQGRQQ